MKACQVMLRDAEGDRQPCGGHLIPANRLERLRRQIEVLVSSSTHHSDAKIAGTLDCSVDDVRAILDSVL